MSDTPRCDTLAQEHQRLMAVPGSPGVVQDWIALARTLERELAEARAAFEDERRTREAIQADFERGVAYAGQLRETLDRFISDSVSREDMERGIADEEDRRLRAENRASELLDEVDDLRAYAGQLREALKEISKMRGCTVRSFEEIRDGWKDACIVAFGQAADIADAALAKNPNPAGPARATEPSVPLSPEDSGAGRAGTTSVHSQGTAQGDYFCQKCAMWGSMKPCPCEPHEIGSATPEGMDVIIRALRAADRFIANGVELGYIRMPAADCPDPAHQTPDLIRAALKWATGQRPDAIDKEVAALVDDLEFHPISVSDDYEPWGYLYHYNDALGRPVVSSDYPFGRKIAGTQTLYTKRSENPVLAAAPEPGGKP